MLLTTGIALAAIVPAFSLLNSAEASHRICFTITIDKKPQEICIPSYFAIRPNIFGPDPCNCPPIEIIVNPEELHKTGLNASAIDIMQGTDFDTVTLKVPHNSIPMNQSFQK